jgi:hypothetical protein
MHAVRCMAAAERRRSARRTGRGFEGCVGNEEGDFTLLAKAHGKNVVVLGPMEVLGLRSDVDKVREHMADGVHLDEKGLDTVVDSLLKKTEEHFVSKKRGHTERSGPDTKRPRMASEGGRPGGRPRRPRGQRQMGRGEGCVEEPVLLLPIGGRNRFLELDCVSLCFTFL